MFRAGETVLSGEEDDDGEDAAPAKSDGGSEAAGAGAVHDDAGDDAASNAEPAADRDASTHSSPSEPVAPLDHPSGDGTSSDEKKEKDE